MLAITNSAFSQEVDMTEAADMIQNLNKVIEEVKKTTSVPVLFPSIIPKDPVKTYYASADLSSQKYDINYLINVDSTPECNGVHACNVGFVKAEKGAKIHAYRNMQNKDITVLVILLNNIKAYYTPGHAMGDYFTANIQWLQDHILYTISWPTEQDGLTKMANSAIAAGSASRR
jgi:hypothetical protein